MDRSRILVFLFVFTFEIHLLSVDFLEVVLDLCRRPSNESISSFISAPLFRQVMVVILGF